LYDDINGRADLMAKRAFAQLPVAALGESFETDQCIFGRVRVNRAHATFVTGVHRLNQFESFGSAHLSDDDAVRAQTQRNFLTDRGW